MSGDRIECNEHNVIEHLLKIAERLLEASEDHHWKPLDRYNAYHRQMAIRTLTGLIGDSATHKNNYNKGAALRLARMRAHDAFNSVCGGSDTTPYARFAAAKQLQEVAESLSSLG